MVALRRKFLGKRTSVKTIIPDGDINSRINIVVTAVRCTYTNEHKIYQGNLKCSSFDSYFII